MGRGGAVESDERMNPKTLLEEGILGQPRPGTSHQFPCGMGARERRHTHTFAHQLTHWSTCIHTCSPMFTLPDTLTDTVVYHTHTWPHAHSHTQAKLYREQLDLGVHILSVMSGGGPRRRPCTHRVFTQGENVCWGRGSFPTQ
jgi:hypothetical protein